MDLNMRTKDVWPSIWSDFLTYKKQLKQLFTNWQLTIGNSDSLLTVGECFGPRVPNLQTFSKSARRNVAWLGDSVLQLTSNAVQAASRSQSHHLNSKSCVCSWHPPGSAWWRCSRPETASCRLYLAESHSSLHYITGPYSTFLPSQKAQIHPLSLCQSGCFFFVEVA